jgi:UDP-N-acetylglucosamine acyltransferase
MPTIHPTAIVDPKAVLADDVSVGPYAIIDGPVSLGAGCTVRARATLIGPLAAGENNDFGINCVIGDRPQHLAFRGGETAVRIGHGNCFREGATVHQPMPGGLTTIGDRNLFMAYAHVAHDCTVGNDAIFVNNSMLGGHSTVDDRAFISGGSAVHQHCRVGTLAMISGVSASTKDVPPFWIMQNFNLVGGINVVGMKRAGMNSLEIMAVRKAFKTIYLKGLTVSAAVEEIEAELGQYAAVKQVVEFIKSSKRGICGAACYAGHAGGGELAAA